MKLIPIMQAFLLEAASVSMCVVYCGHQCFRHSLCFRKRHWLERSRSVAAPICEFLMPRRRKICTHSCSGVGAYTPFGLWGTTLQSGTPVHWILLFALKLKY